MNKILTFLFICLTISCYSTNAQTTTLRFAKLVTGQGEVISDAVVIIEKNIIIKVASGEIHIPSNTNLIDLRPLIAIPGLIDAHTHITYSWDKAPGSNPWSQLGTLGSTATVLLWQENARKTLETGVTTVRDLGSFDNMDLDMRDLIRRGEMIGPRMLIAGNGLFNSRTKGVAEVESFAREQIAAGVDWIKMYGSTGSGNDLTGTQTFTYEEMKAAVDVAHKAGKRISIHSYGSDGARDAVKARTNTLEHATDIDDSTLFEMSRLKIIYVPTVDHNRYYVSHKDEYGYDDTDVTNLNNYIQRNFETLKKAVKAKVKIAMGSDAVFTGFGENTRELEWFVKAGMTPAQALKTATTIGAEMLGMEKELGAIAPGYFADIVAVEGDPLKDIDVVINKVYWVMKDGKVVVDKRQ